jgi:hypothetical protein
MFLGGRCSALVAGGKQAHTLDHCAVLVSSARPRLFLLQAARRLWSNVVMANQYKTDDFSIPYGKETLADWGERLHVTHEELVTHVDEMRNRGDAFTGATKLTPQRSLLYSRRIAADMLSFLIKYQETSLLTEAAAGIGVTSRTIGMWRRQFPLFAELCGELQDAIVDVAEDELYRRAVLGEVTDVWHQGQPVGSYMKKSDELLKFLLNGNRTKYRAKSEVAMTGPAGGPIEVDVADVTALRDKLYEKIINKQVEVGLVKKSKLPK